MESTCLGRSLKTSDFLHVIRVVPEGKNLYVQIGAPMSVCVCACVYVCVCGFENEKNQEWVFHGAILYSVPSLVGTL